MTASRTLREVMDVLEPLSSGTAGGQEVERLPFVACAGRSPHRPVRAAGRRGGRAPASRPASRATGAVLIVDDAAGVAAPLAARLRAGGHAVVRLRARSGRFSRGSDAGDEDVLVAASPTRRRPATSPAASTALPAA